MKLLILRYQFIGITLSKPHLVCAFYDKQINVKKYEWKFGSVQILLVGDCMFPNCEVVYNILSSQQKLPNARIVNRSRITCQHITKFPIRLAYSLNVNRMIEMSIYVISFIIMLFLNLYVCPVN